MLFDDVILGRRSIRGYKPAPVPKALIKEIIGLAMRAPSSMNTQPWNFYIITGEPLNRIRAGNTERNLAGVPHSREFRTVSPLPVRTATGRSAWRNNCSPPWGSRAMTRTGARTG
jgi:Nitroreductase family